jgi:hypothetical protein
MFLYNLVIIGLKNCEKNIQKVTMTMTGLHRVAEVPDEEFTNWIAPLEKDFSSLRAYGASKLSNAYMVN